MFSSMKIGKVFQSVKEAPQQAFDYISDAVFRIFSPTKDNYPATGAQPFDGDPADEK